MKKAIAVVMVVAAFLGGIIIGLNTTSTDNNAAAPALADERTYEKIEWVEDEPAKEKSEITEVYFTYVGKGTPPSVKQIPVDKPAVTGVSVTTFGDCRPARYSRSPEREAHGEITRISEVEPGVYIILAESDDEPASTLEPPSNEEVSALDDDSDKLAINTMPEKMSAEIKKVYATEVGGECDKHLHAINIAPEIESADAE